MSEQENLRIAHEYLRAVANGPSDPALAALLDPEIVLEIFPNAIAPQGSRRDRAQMLASAVHGQALVGDQRWDVRGAIVQGETVAMEVEWRGTLRVALGALPAGKELHARFAMFLELRDGRIVKQRNYDCYDPLG